ncbi:MAG: phosphoadenylyl-sulfate reductase, partial [Deltaproteobacteria bacterium]
MDEKLVEELNARFSGKSPEDVIRWALDEFGDRVALANSFGAEDMVLTDMILAINPDARIFTLDTGRLPEETYRVMARVQEKYGKKIEVYFPRAEDVESM